MDSDYVVSFLGKKLTTFRKSWERIGRDICRIHDLRHHFATMLATSGMPLRAVQVALGHSSIQMTERYSELGEKELNEIFNSFSNSLTNNVPEQLFINTE